MELEWSFSVFGAMCSTGMELQSFSWMVLCVAPTMELRWSLGGASMVLRIAPKFPETPVLCVAPKFPETLVLRVAPIPESLVLCVARPGWSRPVYLSHLLSAVAMVR